MSGRIFVGVKRYDWNECNRRAKRIAEFIDRTTAQRPLNLYPVPPDGDFAANPVRVYLEELGWRVVVVDDPDKAHIFIDTAINTGRTQNEYVNRYGRRFVALVCKRDQGAEADKDYWIVFPWETDEEAVQTRIASLQFDNENFNKREVQDAGK